MRAHGIALKRLFALTSGDAIDSDRIVDEGVPLVGGNGIRGRVPEANTKPPVLVVGRVGAQCGNVHEFYEPIWASEHALRLTPRRVVCLRFYRYWLESRDLHRLATGTAQPVLVASTLGEERIPAPGPTQRAIAAFLDRETAKIDTLIEKKERLLALLEEKHTALITQAVTKGLDPDMPMKDSGVEWLGEVPAHWEVPRVGHRFEVQLGKMLDQSRITGESLAPYLRVQDVQWGTINVESLPRMDFSKADRRRYGLKAGDLLVNEGGSYVGRSAVWGGELDDCYYQKALHRVRPLTDAVTTRFLYYVMVAAVGRGVFVAGGNQTTIDHLTAEQLRRYRVPCPPLKEQLSIAEALDQTEGRLASLGHRITRAISLLREYRSALISAAVTGQIDSLTSRSPRRE